MAVAPVDHHDFGRRAFQRPGCGEPAEPRADDDNARAPPAGLF
jgi:hypothetical protein